MSRPIATVLLVAAAGCGRLAFDARVDGDANGQGDATANAYAELVKSDGPVAYWRFEESGGVVAVDEMGSYPGMFSGALSRVAGIAGGRGAVFDGSSTRVVVGDVFPFPGMAPYTIEVWVFPSVVDASVRFIVDRSTVAQPVDGYQLYYAASFTLNDRSVQGMEYGYAGGPGITANRWTHIVGTYDGNETALYMDGVLINSSISMALPATSPGTFTLGDGGGDQFFKYAGILDEVAIYDTALPADRIAAHTSAGRP